MKIQKHINEIVTSKELLQKTCSDNITDSFL